jgi:hypothetical protein
MENLRAANEELESEKTKLEALLLEQRERFEAQLLEQQERYEARLIEQKQKSDYLIAKMRSYDFNVCFFSPVFPDRIMSYNKESTFEDLLSACESGDCRTVQELLEFGADPATKGPVSVSSSRSKCDFDCRKQ